MVQNETGMFVMPYKKLDNSKTDMDEELVNKIKEIIKIKKIYLNRFKNHRFKNKNIY